MLQTQEIQEMNLGASVLLLYTSLRSERSNAAKCVTEVSMNLNDLTIKLYKKGKHGPMSRAKYVRHYYYVLKKLCLEIQEGV